MPTITSGGPSNAAEEPQAVETVPVASAAQAPAAEPAAPAEAPAPETPAVDVTSMNKAELQAHADSLGLPTDGTKADLTARIAGAAAPAAETAPPEVPQP